MKMVCIIGHFGKGKELLNGQTIKTKIIDKELTRVFGKKNVVEIDTYGGVKALPRCFFQLISCFFSCRNIIMLPAYNGIRVFTPLIFYLNKIFHRKLHYVVIGGWLAKFINDKNALRKQLQCFDGIYVETNVMKYALENEEFKNVIVVPNCKFLNILRAEDLNYITREPFKVCTFSRVMKEKGIEEAVRAVEFINKQAGRSVFTLDIYGQIDSNQVTWFSSLMDNVSNQIKYKGQVPYDASVAVVKQYYALLFPTYYQGEGFAGTLIDAYAAGVPVIASNWKYNSELVKEGVTGTLFETNNIDSLINEMMNAVEKPNVWNAQKVFCVNEAKNYLPENALHGIINNLR